MTTIDSLFAEQIDNLLGAEQAADLLRALEHSEPSVSVRVNERRGRPRAMVSARLLLR